MPTDLRFPLCISEQTVARDFDATLRFKPSAARRARAAGLVLRAQSANDYYVVRADALEVSVRLYRMEKRQAQPDRGQGCRGREPANGIRCG